MKKWIALVLIIMLFGMPAYAVERAAYEPDWNVLERYAAFAEEGSVWTVRSNQAEAALARMSAETAPYSGYACFGLELTGDRATGIVAPVLTFYYAGSVKLNASVASISANGKRYDIALHSESIQLGKNEAEKMTALLDRDGLKMIHEILNAEEPAVLLQGDTTYRMEPMQVKDYESPRAELAGRSLEALEHMLSAFESIEKYELWDLNEAWWERTRGEKPEMQILTLPSYKEIEIGEIELEEPMYLLARGDQGSDVQDLQELLTDKGYLQGAADGAYGGGTVRAVRAAQMQYGLMPTGLADETLLSILTSREPVLDGTAADHMTVDDKEIHAAEGLCELTIGRYWIADAVESTGGDRRTVSDRDDTLIIYEGTVKNLSTENLDFYWQLSAKVKYGEYEYPCVLVCERNGGDTLATALPPLGEARLLVYAEIPETIAGEEGWKLELDADGTVFLFE